MAVARKGFARWRSIAGDAGATAVEYALMIALISVVILGAVGTLGTNLDDKFGRVKNAVGGQGGNSGSTNGWGMGSGGGQDHTTP